MKRQQQGRVQGSIAELPPLRLRDGRAAESTEGTTPAGARRADAGRGIAALEYGPLTSR